MMTIVTQLRARPVQVLFVLLLLNGLATGAMMVLSAPSDHGTDSGIAIALIGGSALLATLAALIALFRLVQDPLERVENAVRSLSVEVARGSDPVSGLGLPLAASGDITASMRALLRLRQVISERNRRAEQYDQQRRNVDELLTAEVMKRNAEEQVRRVAIAELADGLRRLANGELGAQIELAVPPELEPVRIHFNRTSAMLADSMGGDGSHAAVVRDTGIVLAASTELAKQGADQAGGIIELRRSASLLGLCAGTRAEEAQELAARAAWARTEIMQCAQKLSAAKVAIEAFFRTTAEMAAAADSVRDMLRETSCASLDLGMGAVQSQEKLQAASDISTLLHEVRGLADSAARAASRLSSVSMPSASKAVAASTAIETSLADIEVVGQQIEALEERAASLARASFQDAGVGNDVELVARELEAGARNHANTVEQTVLAMSELSRSLGRVELKLGLFRQSKPPLPTSPSMSASSNTTPPTGPRPYLRRVK